MGKIYVVGIGPGKKEHMSFRAHEAIKECEIIVGYSTYIKLIKDNYKDKKFLEFKMRKEIERCEYTLNLALENKKIALISGGDSGIYGMAGIMLEIMNKKSSNIDIEIVPGISALNMAASVLGAPLMHDFAVISLSDLLTPWKKIEQRIEYSAKSDFVMCIYNPRSKGRSDYIFRIRDIIKKFRKKNTPVGIVRNAGRDKQEVNVTTLEKIENFKIDMLSVLIIGNNSTYTENGKIITPRGYMI